MFVEPPSEQILDPFEKIASDSPEKLNDYLTLFSPTDQKGRYQHYDEIRFRIPRGLNLPLAWSVIKLAREKQSKTLIRLGEHNQACRFVLTPTMQTAISEIDRYTTDGALERMLSNIGEREQLEYLLDDLAKDEAINSSQLEGAATTTSVAKELLKRKRKPRTTDERMILGNFKMMKFAWQNKHQKLSIDLILAFHQVGVEQIDDEKYCPGSFRENNDIVVVDAKGKTLHRPPPVEGLQQRLSRLVEWANKSDSQEALSNEYVHPVIRAIALHFTIGYEHPFRDGNGRVARSLFYWYLFKHDFAAFRYIAISQLLKAAPVQYGKSYLYTETDNMDLTYFIDYQCKIILRAIATFKQSYEQTLAQMQKVERWLQHSRLYNQLSEKQRLVIQIAQQNTERPLTVIEIKENLGCAYNTAASILNSLVDLGLFKKEKIGREWLFFPTKGKDENN